MSVESWNIDVEGEKLQAHKCPALTEGYRQGAVPGTWGRRGVYDTQLHLKEEFLDERMKMEMAH